jgi:DNA-binding NtrC family response regulator
MKTLMREEMIRRLRDSQVLAKLVGEAPVFLQAIASLPAIASGEAAVLISGETGTGKELIARAIHYISQRASHPFVPVNCGSLPDTLLEDELFGHERGAFTDAHMKRTGLIAQADKGTLFLDEVDALSMKAQVTLLRVLQDKRYRAIGGSGERQTDIRIVAATNARLESLAQTAAFRADLYYRLCVFSVHLPALRQRKEDIPLLAEHFLKKHSPGGKTTFRLSASAMAALFAHEWPGNVRELENAIIRGIHLSGAEVIEVADLGLNTIAAPEPEAEPGTPLNASSFKALKQEMIEAFERDYLIRLMAAHHGNITQAARSAGKERRDLGKLLKKYHLDPNHFRAANQYT